MLSDGTYTWIPITSEKVDWLYSDDDKDAERGCIGHLRGDFSRGQEFWTTWHPHLDKLNKEPFKTEFDTIVNQLRRQGCILANFQSMSNQCYQHAAAKLTTSFYSYGFQLETERYQYFLRCSPVKGDYNFYIYCCDKNAQREYMQDQTVGESPHTGQGKDSFNTKIQSAEMRSFAQHQAMDPLIKGQKNCPEL